MGFQHYGLDSETAKRLQLLCRSEDKEIRAMVKAACELSNEGLARYLYRSLTCGDSFEDLSKETYLPAVPKDFYGCRRKAIAIFGNMYLKRLLPQEGA
jgi:hypothetical protein